MKSRGKITAETGIQAAAWVLILPVLLLPISNPDLFWHLNAADWIVSNAALPRADFFSFTRMGAPWVDFEWLIQLIYYGVHEAAGLPGLYLLKVLMMVMAALPILALADLHRVKAPLRAALLLFWGALVLGRSDLKPEMFSVILFSLQLWFLEARRLGRIKERTAAQLACSAFFYFAFWANLHLAFVTGLLLLGAYGLERPREYVLILAAAALGTLANPYGLGVYQVLLEHSRLMPALTQYIFEWQPPAFSDLYDGPTWLLVGLVSIAYAGQTSWNRRPPTAHIAGVVIFGAMFLLHSRQNAYFIPMGLLALIESAGPIAGELRRLGFDAGRFFAVLWVAAFLGYAGHLIDPGLLGQVPYYWGLLPVAATDFVESELPAFRKRRVFNQWGWGGYLSYRLQPDVRVFMDGRYIFHPFLKEVGAALDGPFKWQRFLQRQNIEWVFIRNDPQSVSVESRTSENKPRTILLPHLPVYYPSRRWALVYRDPQSVIYVRRGAFPKDWIARLEIR